MATTPAHEPVDDEPLIEALGQGDQPLVLFRRADAELLAGRPITDDEARTLVNALQHSTISEAFSEVVFAVCGSADDDPDL